MVNELRVCNCISLHDFKLEGIKWKEWFDYCLSFFTKHNLEPMRLSVHGIHYGNSVKSMTFKGGLRKLEKFNFEGIHRLSFMVMEDKDDYTSDFIIEASLYPDLKNHHESTATFCIDAKLEPFTQIHFEDIATKFFDYAKPKYGYYYSRMLKHRPVMYLHGGSSSELRHFANEEDMRRCKVWSRKTTYDDDFFQKKDLRDIYKLNFLSPEHLSRDIRPIEQQSSGEPVTLEAWINAAPDRGELKELRPGFWSWYVPDELTELVRNSLLPSGIILTA